MLYSPYSALYSCCHRRVGACTCLHQSREISGNTIADAKHVHPLSDNVFPHSKVVRLSKGCLIAMRAGNMNDDIFLPNTVICFEIIIDITEIIVYHVNKYQQ